MIEVPRGVRKVVLITSQIYSSSFFSQLCVPGQFCVLEVRTQETLRNKKHQGGRKGDGSWDRMLILTLDVKTLDIYLFWVCCSYVFHRGQRSSTCDRCAVTVSSIGNTLLPVLRVWGPYPPWGLLFYLSWVWNGCIIHREHPPLVVAVPWLCSPWNRILGLF